MESSLRKPINQLSFGIPTCFCNENLDIDQSSTRALCRRRPQILLLFISPPFPHTHTHAELVYRATFMRCSADSSRLFVALSFGCKPKLAAHACLTFTSLPLVTFQPCNLVAHSLSAPPYSLYTIPRDCQDCHGIHDYFRTMWRAFRTGPKEATRTISPDLYPTIRCPACVGHEGVRKFAERDMRRLPQNRTLKDNK